MVAGMNIDAVRARFEAYILTERSKLYLERNDPALDSQHDYKNHFVQEAWESWCACAGVDNPAQFNPIDDTLTIFGVKYSVGLFQTLGIAPIGSAFRVVGRYNEELMLQTLSMNPQHAALIEEVRSYFAREYDGVLEAPGPAIIAALSEPVIPIPNPSHIHCETCEGQNCPGIQVRQALPQTDPSSEAVRRARGEGRAEAFELLTGVSAEDFGQGETYIGEHAIADSGDYESHWNEDALRELFHINEPDYSLIDQLEAGYWTQQAFIDGLQIQLNGEWLPIEAASSDKDGRYILGWFEDLPRGLKIELGDPPTPWVAAVRWGGDASLWGMLGVGGLMPTKFKPILGPTGQPVGYIRPPAPEISA